MQQTVVGICTLACYSAAAFLIGSQVYMYSPSASEVGCTNFLACILEFLLRSDCCCPADGCWCAFGQDTEFYKTMRVAEGILRGYVTVLKTVDEATKKCAAAGLDFRVRERLFLNA
jgi:hypothetical protein